LTGRKEKTGMGQEEDSGAKDSIRKAITLKGHVLKAEKADHSSHISEGILIGDKLSKFFNYIF
jgi:hypothetical protein